MASCLLRANSKLSTKLLSHVARGVINCEHYYGGHRNLMSIAWNGEAGFPNPGTLPLHDAYKPQDRTIDLQTLKEKEKHDWRLLTMEEKKMLYDVSARQPYCDVLISEDAWKPILGGAFVAMGLMTFGIYMWLTTFAYSECKNLLHSSNEGIEGTELMLGLMTEENVTSITRH